MVEWALTAAAVLLGAGPALAFRALAARRTYEVEDAPPRPAALVLGARLFAPGIPSTLLLHRLEAARALLARGAVERLVLTGLPDEVEAMGNWLLEEGVGAGQLVVDARSPRTIASFRRARVDLGLERVAVVTNPFHLPRSLFLARRAGLDAIGVAARPGLEVSRATMLKNQAREAAACLRALWDVRRG